MVIASRSERDDSFPYIITYLISSLVVKLQTLSKSFAFFAISLTCAVYFCGIIKKLSALSICLKLKFHNVLRKAEFCCGKSIVRLTILHCFGHSYRTILQVKLLQQMSLRSRL